jgi:MFS family permease
MHQFLSICCISKPPNANQLFRYAVDSMLTLLQSIIASQAALEFNASYSRALTISVYVGLLLGALLWGLTADMIGRKIAFNTSLFICSGACIVAGASPSWESLAFFIALVGFGGGGNLILDTTVFLEYLPSNKQWVLSNERPNHCEKKANMTIAWLAAWWGLGQAVAGFLAWGFMGT